MLLCHHVYPQAIEAVPIYLGDDAQGAAGGVHTLDEPAGPNLDRQRQLLDGDAVPPKRNGAGQGIVQEVDDADTPWGLKPQGFSG